MTEASDNAMRHGFLWPKRVDTGMKVIGITGGVGCGKTKLLSYIQEHYNCQVILADEVAHQVKAPGELCYEKLVLLLGDGIVGPGDVIDRSRMAELIFADPGLLGQVNDIIHPAVKERILQEISDRETEGKLDLLFVEAALLIEGGYAGIVDELWYVYADEKSRRARLKSARAYTDEKIERIMRKQLSEDAFRQNCKVVIDNSGSLEAACKQIDEKLEEYLCQRK